MVSADVEMFDHEFVPELPEISEFWPQWRSRESILKVPTNLRFPMSSKFVFHFLISISSTLKVHIIVWKWIIFYHCFVEHCLVLGFNLRFVWISIFSCLPSSVLLQRLYEPRFYRKFIVLPRHGVPKLVASHNKSMFVLGSYLFVFRLFNCIITAA